MSKTQVQIPQQPFTVLAIRPDSAQILCIQVEAIDGFHAFTVASEHEQTKGDVEMVVALTGHQQEGQLLTFPGNNLVDSQTIREQPEIFDGSRLADSACMLSAAQQGELLNLFSEQKHLQHKINSVNEAINTLLSMS